MGLSSAGRSTVNMEKVVCLLAVTGLVSSVPTYYQQQRALPGIISPLSTNVVSARSGAPVGQTRVVNHIIGELSGPIDDAIAMYFDNIGSNGQKITGTFNQGPIKTGFIEGSTSGQNSQTSFQGFSASKESSFSSHTSSEGSSSLDASYGSSASGGSSLTSGTTASQDDLVSQVVSNLNLGQVIQEVLSGTQGNSDLSSTFVGSSGVSGVAVGAAEAAAAVAATVAAESAGSVEQTGATFSSSSFSGEKSSSAGESQTIISTVVTSLVPAIELAVQQALAGQSSTSVSTSGVSNQATSGQSLTDFSTSVSSSSVNQESLVARILSILRPQIIELVTIAIRRQEQSVATEEALRLEEIRIQQEIRRQEQIRIQEAVRQEEIRKEQAAAAFAVEQARFEEQKRLERIRIEQANAVRLEEIRRQEAAAAFAAAVNQQSLLINQVLAALTPTIQQTIASLMAQSSTASNIGSTSSIQTTSQQSSVLSVAQAEINTLVQRIIITLTPIIRSAVEAALAQQSQSVTSTTSLSFSSISIETLVERIISILRTQIIKLVTVAIERRDAAAETARLEQLRLEEIRRQENAAAAAAAEQARLDQLRRQEAERLRQEAERLRQEQLLLQQQQQTEPINPSGEGSSLSTLFGFGHEVSVTSAGTSHQYEGQESAAGTVGK